MMNRAINKEQTKPYEVVEEVGSLRRYTTLDPVGKVL